MSEKEHDKTTEEMFEVVNNHASLEATQRAEKIARRATEVAAEKEKAEAEAEYRKQAEIIDAEIRRQKRNDVMVMIFNLIILTLAAALFVAALLLPSWVPVLCFAGIAACLIVGAVVTDRFILSRR